MKRLAILLAATCIAAESPSDPHVIRIDPAMFADRDAVLVVEYGDRRISLTADQAMWALEDALFRWHAERGGKRRGK
jgi:hypothetical protein